MASEISTRSAASVEPPLQVSLAVLPERNGSFRASVEVTGEIDIATVGLVRTAVLAFAAAPRTRGRAVRLVLDWQGVSFLDSSGVYLLEELRAKATEERWSLQWMPPTAPGPARLLGLAADHGWLPRQLSHSGTITARHGATVG